MTKRRMRCFDERQIEDLPEFWEYEESFNKTISNLVNNFKESSKKGATRTRCVCNTEPDKTKERRI